MTLPVSRIVASISYAIVLIAVSTPAQSMST